MMQGWIERRNTRWDASEPLWSHERVISLIPILREKISKSNDGRKIIRDPKLLDYNVSSLVKEDQVCI